MVMSVIYQRVNPKIMQEKIGPIRVQPMVKSVPKPWVPRLLHQSQIHRGLHILQIHLSSRPTLGIQTVGDFTSGKRVQKTMEKAHYVQWEKPLECPFGSKIGLARCGIPCRV